MSNAQNLLPVFSCSFFFFSIKVNAPQKCDATVPSDRRTENHRTVVCLCVGTVCLAALFGIRQTPGSFGFVTFCGPSAPVPPIVPEFSIFGLKWDSWFVWGSPILIIREPQTHKYLRFFFFFFVLLNFTFLFWDFKSFFPLKLRRNKKRAKLIDILG